MDTQSFALPFQRPSPFAPPPEYAALRRDSPVVRTTTGAGTPAWLVLGAAEAQRVLADRRFAITREGVEVDTESLLCDGEPHARLRGALSRGLSPRTLDRLRPRVDGLAHGLVADLRAGGAPGDLVAGLSRPLTRAVIAEVLGVPADARSRFDAWAESVSVAIVDDLDGGVEVWLELIDHLGGLIADKRADPGADLLSELVAIRDDGRLNDRELVLAAAALLSGGYLTTINSLSIGLVKLLAHGGLGGLGDEAAAERAVEEVLRHQAGLSGEAIPRWARADVELAGLRIAAGDMVLVRLEAANRDPAVFDEPDRFDPTRRPRPHVRFGYGPHRCIGAAVARMELVAAVRALADQLPGLALSTPPEELPWTDHPIDTGPERVPATW
ncbi:cytochrome P450 [Saccharopolyspora sp. CA-218241]|uniref:cytochrome P450 n=1 Tax=Saccharopolyspora sp. CA-218241 TaxID=3240027 RepID=UPI003D989326